MNDAYYRDLVTRLQAENRIWEKERHPLDEVARTTAALLLEAARAIAFLAGQNRGYRGPL